MALLSKEGAPVGATDPTAKQIHTILGVGASFAGKLTFQGAVRIDGDFSGEIITDDLLIVGDEAKVNAQISVGTLIVYGEVNGNVTAAIEVQLMATSRLTGDVTCPSLTVAQGALLNGAISMVRE